MKHILIFAAAIAEETAADEERSTALEEARCPLLDQLAQQAEVGTLRSIPLGLAASSSVALLSVLGYEPEIYGTQGLPGALPSLRQRYGFSGAMVCADPEIQTLAEAAALLCLPVKKEEGKLAESYQRKMQATMKALAEGCNFVCIHLVEAAQAKDRAEKTRAIEAMERELIAPLLEKLDQQGEAYHLLLTAGYAASPGQESPSSEPVPFLIYRSDRAGSPSAAAFNEKEAAASGLFLSAGPMLMQRFSGKYQCDFQFDCIPGL